MISILQRRKQGFREVVGCGMGRSGLPEPRFFISVPKYLPRPLFMIFGLYLNFVWSSMCLLSSWRVNVLSLHSIFFVLKLWEEKFVQDPDFFVPFSPPSPYLY